MEEYREEVRGMYVAGTGEATGDGVQQEIFSLEQERMRLEVVKATEVIDTVEDGTCPPLHLPHASEY